MGKYGQQIIENKHDMFAINIKLGAVIVVFVLTSAIFLVVNLQ